MRCSDLLRALCILSVVFLAGSPLAQENKSQEDKKEEKTEEGLPLKAESQGRRLGGADRPAGPPAAGAGISGAGPAAPEQDGGCGFGGRPLHLLLGAHRFVRVQHVLSHLAGGPL